MLDVRKLKALREIALRGSFSAAAEQLNYSQSAVSQQVAQLERQVGTMLVERRGRTVRLTSAGRTLVDRADVILRQLAEAEAELEAAAGGRRTTLRIATFGSALATWMPAAIRSFRQSHQGTTVVLTIADSDAAVELVLGGEADIAVISCSGARRLDGALLATALHRDPLRVALPLEHPLAGRAYVRLGDLAAESWMVATSCSCADWDVFNDACRHAGFEPRIGYRHDDYLALLGLVAAGLGIGLIPGVIQAATRCEGVMFRPIGPREPMRHVTAATIRAPGQSPTVSAMVAELRACVPAWSASQAAAIRTAG